MNGRIQSEFFAEYLDYDDDKKNFHEGEATWYYENGEVEQKRYYFNNKINGKNSFYHENGELKEERTYNYGILNGTYRQWYKSGKNKVLALYENGKLLGEKYIEFDENGTGAFVHHENFQANKAKWESKTSDAYSKVKFDNELSLVLTGESIATRFNHISINQSGDYSIESIIHKNTGKTLEGYGLIFGFQDRDNYFEFSISEQGSFIIYQKFEGVNIKIKDWTSSNAIYKGNQRNKLKILKLNDDFIFSINGEVIAQQKSSLFRGNNIGIMARGRGEFTLENIIVREFVTEEELAKLSTEKEDESSSEWKGTGSGFFLSEDGYIATNYHVVEDAEEIQVEYLQQGNKRIHPAVVVVSDKQNDLSIIKIKDPSFRRLAIIPYAFSTSIKDVGSSVFTLGYPMTQIMGEEIKFTDGKINSKTGIGGDITHYQISVPIQPGNSGGPLFDEQGYLVGITSSGLDRDRFTAQNVNYAVKSSYLKNLIDVLPSKIPLPNFTNIANRTLTDKIKILSDYIPIIRVK
jgi:S1-C subfamily serine protease/antitoxin component YwqK of YwqJK toxin-antitoxin module